MPQYKFNEKDENMCDNLAQVWALAENRELHFKDVKDAEKPEVVSDLFEKQRQISGWLYDVKSKNENRQEAWEHLQEVGERCRTYLAQMQNVKKIKEENLIYAGAQPNTARSVDRLLRGERGARARSDEFISSFVDMVDQANQYGIIGPKNEIRMQQNLQAYRKAIIYKNRQIAELPRPARVSQDEMDQFVAEYDPELDEKIGELEKQVEEEKKGNIPPVPEGPGPVKVEDVPDDNYQRLREARERVQAQHQREEEAIRLENARLKAEAERLLAEQKRAEHEKWVQHEKEEEEIRAMNARLKAEAEQIKNEHLRAEREKQEQERQAQQKRVEQERQAQQKKAEQERQQQKKAEQERQPQQKKAKQERPLQQQKVQPEPSKRPMKEEKGIQAGGEPSAANEKEKTRRARMQPVVAEHLAFHAARAPHVQAVQGLMNRLQYSERILRDVAARLEWMQQNPMNQMQYAPLMNSFQRSMAVPVFQSVLQYQNMPQYQNATPYKTMPQQTNPQLNQNSQMAYRGTQMNYGNPMNPQMVYQNPYMGGQPRQNQNQYMYNQTMQSQSPYMYNQSRQSQSPYMYTQAMQSQNPYMYGQSMQNQNPYMYAGQQEKMRMVYMLQNMSLVKLALTYAAISIMETCHQVQDRLNEWANEWANEKNSKTKQKVSEATHLKEQKTEKTASKSSGRRRVKFKDLEKQENLVRGKTEKKKIPMTMEREPLTRQKAKGMTH